MRLGEQEPEVIGQRGREPGALRRTWLLGVGGGGNRLDLLVLVSSTD